jgi:hypothetical protein
VWPLTQAEILVLAGEEARASRQPILLFVTRPGWFFRERARREYFLPLTTPPAWLARMSSPEISRDRKIRGFEGRETETTGAELASAFGIRAYPTAFFVPFHRNQYEPN